MNGNLAESGAVSWMFEHKGIIRATGTLTEDELLEKLLDYDIDDVTLDEGIFSIECPANKLDIVKKTVESLGLKIEASQLEWVPKNYVTLDDSSKSESVYKFLEMIEDLDDVQNVYANLGD
jgi:transcriptional/translational regulatory protein YebC/TACO1